MSNETKHEMTSSANADATIMAAMARIAAVPAGKTLIESIKDDEWSDPSSAEKWMINAGSDDSGCSEELDESDEATVAVA